MSDLPAPDLPAYDLREADSRDALEACFPVIHQLRPRLADAAEWVARASTMAAAGYRVLAAWDGEQAVALAGYRINENLIYGRFLYVDDLVTLDSRRGEKLGATLLQELTGVAKREKCQCLVLDTAETNSEARRFYKREGLLERAVGLVKPLEQAP